MIIPVNKKSILITSLCLFGTLFTAYRIYCRSLAAKAKLRASLSSKNASAKRSTGNGAHRSQSTASGGGSGLKSTLGRQSALTNSEGKATAAAAVCRSASSKQSSSRSIGSSSSTSAASVAAATARSSGDTSPDGKNLPAEELLELGMNYLNQAIRSWETALDSIEASAYMQSNTLALPNDEHSDLVYKLRKLVDMTNDINLSCNTTRLVKSSQTLQIIQSRLSYKQQVYADALIKSNHASSSALSAANSNSVPIASSDAHEDAPAAAEAATAAGSYTSTYSHMESRFQRRASVYQSDDDNDSFVSADSDVDWLNEEMLRNIENVDEKNVLYEMAMSSVHLGNLNYRVSRAHLLDCKSDEDFAAKLHVVRLGFDRLMQETEKKQWLIAEGKNMLSNFITKAEKDPSGFNKAFDELIRFCSVESNWKHIKDELATREVFNMNVYDVALDFILLDAFEDLESPPSAVLAVIQNTWLSQSFKETALSTAVWTVLKGKRKLLKYPDGFITRFYSINEYLVPVLAWGFLGTDTDLNRSCSFLKSQIIDYLKCLFDINKTRYTNLEELTNDIEAHTRRYITEINEFILA